MTPLRKNQSCGTPPPESLPIVRRRPCAIGIITRLECFDLTAPSAVQLFSAVGPRQTPLWHSSDAFPSRPIPRAFVLGTRPLSTSDSWSRITHRREAYAGVRTCALCQKVLDNSSNRSTKSDNRSLATSESPKLSLPQSCHLATRGRFDGRVRVKLRNHLPRHEVRDPSRRR